MGFQGVLAFLLVAGIIFLAITAIVNILGILGIVFGCVSSDRSGKYVSMRGNTDYSLVRKYATASKVFLVLNSIIFGLLLIFTIMLCFELNEAGGTYVGSSDNYEEYSVIEIISSFLGSSAIPIASLVTGGISIGKFNAAKELKDELDSKGLKSYPLPQNQYRPPYQNQNYYQNYPNRNYPNQYYTNPNYPNPNYQSPNQSQWYSLNNTPPGQQGTPQTNAPTGPAAPPVDFPPTPIKCPACGAENSRNNKFCTGCGEMLK